MKLEFSRHIFGKSSNVKFRQNPSSTSRVIPCGQTDGHDEANSRFSQFSYQLPSEPEILLRFFNFAVA
jgi:hypothetical protein